MSLKAVKEKGVDRVTGKQAKTLLTVKLTTNKQNCTQILRFSWETGFSQRYRLAILNYFLCLPGLKKQVSLL